MHIGELAARTDGGFRLHAGADVEKIILIRRLEPLGFALDQMSAAVHDVESQHPSDPIDDRVTEARDRLSETLNPTAGRREDLARQPDRANEVIHLRSERRAWPVAQSSARPRPLRGTAEVSSIR